MNKYTITSSLLAFVAFYSSASIDINKKNNFYLMTNGSPVRDVIKDFSESYGIPVVISGKVQGEFVGRINSVSPNDFLVQLSKEQQLTWFFEDDILFIYNKNEVVNELLTPVFVDVNKIIQTASKLNVLNRNSCAIKKLNNHNTIDAYGVPKCIELLKNIIANLDKESQSKVNNKDTIRAFKLKNASAVDTKYSYRNQTVNVPGVASILKDMVKNGSLNTDGKEPVSLSGVFLSGGAQITSDHRQNSIIIKDKELVMPIYEDLIKILDVKQKQIEISVSIIDVNADDLETLGVNWSGGVSFGKVGLSVNTTASTSGIGNSVIANANDFMVKVNALETSSKAKILSQPSIITLDNMEAILDKSTTFYTKLIGEKNSSLETITSGTLLKVTPRILPEKDNIEEVRLLIEIQDGNQTNGADEQKLPVVNNSVITTEAILSAEQSILLGGVIQEKESTDKSGVYFLKDIPVIGGLFKSSAKRKVSVVRLFLINARPIKNA
ncbi:EscC/YscC/HrcC family type III secretion system outer membrane ring protein [Salmonella enterica]|nr:EscC/YscC/HrcC family type III secretion system outer membrane ring protein [Salmonella enterica]EEU6243855.1 EscC/YscC/HrcC family type III secretion system outer membrane ring protein [Salmonella enterica]EGH5015939.1 EscC/YscC/HrcC family type III secretion system outer membrane ring protein [Salmonella enterica]EHM5449646.1 EscC/YscC/HrcC family type III secretion system outer membrane ring protein [Salmonella enterica]EHO8997859.1 EscC/YscC/HrcC family type III secretion system outer me